MDRFLEEVVIKRQRVMENVLYFLALAMMVVSGVIALMIFSVIFYAFSVPTLVALLFFGGMAVYLFLFRDRLKLEYEYTFTNGSLDFAQVFNNKKRKNLGSLNCKTVDAFGKVSSQSFQRYVSMQGVKQLRWFLNRDAELYYFYFQKDGNKSIIVLEPSEQMVEYIRFYLPHGAYQE
ncbi:MAG: hypothetical protein J1E43_02445 [Christensenellaceae bacterium]|nr:hypothetical protein [Christensenellaceae bacterium]